MYLSTPYKIQYDIKKFPFREIIKDILDINKYNLEEIHLIKNYELFKREEDQSTIWHKKYYDKFKEKVEPLYLELIKHLKETFEYDEIIYQVIPTFRVQLANGNVAVGEWHKDKTYNHSTSEVNFWLPFVDTNDQNTIWCESKEDKGDYYPYYVNYGEILVFNGSNLLNGNKLNNSEKTRISIDFRLVEKNKFKPNKKGSINTNTKFDIGGYFKKM